MDPNGPTPRSPKVRVLYVLSSPHSGSTILGIVLSGHPDVFYAGELFEIPDPAWNPDRSCSCGVSAAACPFWTPIREQYEAAHPPESRSVDRLEWRAFPRLLLARWIPSLAPREYLERVRSLAKAIAERSGRSIVVDTSKDATRALAYELASGPEFDVRFLHLVRDARGVVASRIRREGRVAPGSHPRKGTALRYSLLWAGANVLFSLFFGLRRDRCLTLRHEDVLRDPETALRKLGDLLDVDMGPLLTRVRAQEGFAPVHVVAGNRLRLQGPLRIRKDRAAVPEVSPAEGRTDILWVVGLLSRLYGYPEAPQDRS